MESFTANICDEFGLSSVSRVELDRVESDFFHLCVCWVWSAKKLYKKRSISVWSFIATC